MLTTTERVGKQFETWHHLNLLHRQKSQKRKMKTGHSDKVAMLLAAVILMDIFQVKAEILDMADDAFDDEYLKCIDKMEIKYVPQLLKEEKASHQLLKDVWENAKAKWEAQKTQLSVPVNFKDNHGIALMAYISEAQAQTPFYHMFSEAVKVAGQSRKDYIYGFQFKALHFYLSTALQLLRRPCEDSHKNVVYSLSQRASFPPGKPAQARFGHFALAYTVQPQTASDQDILLTIHTCFAVAVDNFFDKESERIVLIPLNEVFHVSQGGTGNNLILQSTNKTCSHYDCAFLGGLKTAHCVENTGVENHEPTQIPGMKIPEPFSLPEYKSQEDIDNPSPGPVPVPGPKTHPSASSGTMLLPPFGTFIISIGASAINLFVAL
ncbi:ecto-ADP-ribosyltransferase 3 isoform X13 [Manis pentadactyla]|uniref:ecto-ADP-ribosyltransferase 3 isoform X13 n=1 Tax=Manis pentadactyla TaxID=143292 RepID=UPI00255C7D12|nr:ecto-ADP-ribosyltransferase 3 isoform X13 [Manis pentadactyla]